MLNRPEEALSPFQQAMVALDLETTGLDPQHDAIIEVGAVKFRGRRVLDTLTSLVNPYRSIPPFVQRLTGITPQEVAKAPPFATVAGDLADFVGDLPVVGHNVRFDLGFLAKSGLRFNAPYYDTLEMASVLKARGEYSLGNLTREFGLLNANPHRALADAAAAHLLLMALVDKALELELPFLEELHRLATQAGWPLRHLLRGLIAERGRSAPSAASTAPPGGIDLEKLWRRLEPPGRSADHTPVPASPAANAGDAFDREKLAALLKPGGAASAALPGYEHRMEQEQMLRAVAETLEEGGQLMVEAGTGVGKSLAYLLPAAVYAMQQAERVVVSTNTIGLQEQLMAKDLPAVARILAAGPGAAASVPGVLRFAQLKGRGNYLCLRRWSALRSSLTLSEDEAKVLGKLLLWLQSTASGDRSELRLAARDSGVWERLSAQGAKGCPLRGVPCFLEAARRRAEQADVLVVNHALLLADLALGGGLLPPYDHLIVDEAHHLEAEATRQFGYAVSQDALDAHLESLGGARGLASEAVRTFARAALEMTARRQITERAAQRLTERVAQARQAVSDLFSGLAAFLYAQGGESAQRRTLLRVTGGIRALPEWSRLEIAEEAASKALRASAAAAGELSIALDGLGGNEVAQVQAELDSQIEVAGELSDRMDEFVLRPAAESVYWIEEDAAGDLRLNGAPLRVDRLLKRLLFDRKRAVVLTSATLSTAGSLKSIKALLGAPDAQELVVGSPFDYRRLALVCAPRDMPEPTTPTYEQAAAQALLAVARVAKGRTMALFTSYASLRAAADQVRGDLEAEGIRVLAQGQDGSAAQLMERFQADPAALLMGTASFWEGVDLVGEQLQVLVLVRLPFSVPTEPIFAARSETFEDPFNEYAVPQAVLRFRQGFGRLIRSSRDRGAVVVLDRRFLSRSYGATFRSSLPPCRVVTPSLGELPDQVAAWLRVAG